MDEDLIKYFPGMTTEAKELVRRMDQKTLPWVCDWLLENIPRHKPIGADLIRETVSRAQKMGGKC